MIPDLPWTKNVHELAKIEELYLTDLKVLENETLPLISRKRLDRATHFLDVLENEAY